MAPKKILALVLAGGHDPRLHALTLNHPKSSMLFCGHRLVDFVLSNLVNSGLESIYLLAEHNSESLIEHIHANWTFADNDKGRFINIALPTRGQDECYGGTADVVYQNIGLIERHAPDLVAVFASDQVYRMDVRQMVAHHLKTGAAVTVAATRVPIGQAPSLGILVKGRSDEIWDFQKKPDNQAPVPFDPTHAYAAIGNYLFNTEVLLASLKGAAQRGETDFGMNLLPELIRNYQLCAYDLATNRVPGAKPYEEPGYWRDIGSLEAYVDAAHEITGKKHPRFSLHNPNWPILPLKTQQPPANFAVERDYFISRFPG